MRRMSRVIDHEKTSKKIREYINMCSLTPKEVAKRVPLSSVQPVYKWMDERNKTIPRIDVLVQLTEIFDVTLDDLVVIKQV